MLTGESLPIDAGPGVDTYAGALVQRGEATAVGTATGVRTRFGRTAELVRIAHVESSQQLNSIIKKIVQVLLLAVGLIMTGDAILTPLLMVIVMVTGDFLAMSLTTDTVRPSERPNSWMIGRITIAGVVLGSCLLVFCTVVLAFGKYELRLGVEQLRTLAVVSIVYGSQATIHAIRDRRHFWGPRPSTWLAWCSVADLLIITVLAVGGIAMARLAPMMVAFELAAAIVFWLILGGLKIPVFSRLRIS